MINVYCQNWGWLFEDLKADIAAVAEDVVASDEPLPDADAWICIRTGEASKCPNLSRCVVQVHDFRENPIPGRPGAISLVHPRQQYSCTGKAWNPPPLPLTLPIGARRLFTLRESMPERFTVGWVGRDVVYQGRHIKRPQLFVDAVLEARRQGCDVDTKMYGPGLVRYCGRLCRDVLDCDVCEDGNRAESLRDFYHSIDALIVTCEPEPGPLSVYEALACGVPVIGNCFGALERMAESPGRFFTADNERFLSLAIANFGSRERWFNLRHEIRASVTHWQDDWCKAQVELARSLCA